MANKYKTNKGGDFPSKNIAGFLSWSENQLRGLIQCWAIYKDFYAYHANRISHISAHINVHKSKQISAHVDVYQPKQNSTHVTCINFNRILSLSTCISQRLVIFTEFGNYKAGLSNLHKEPTCSQQWISLVNGGARFRYSTFSTFLITDTRFLLFW